MKQAVTVISATNRDDEFWAKVEEFLNTHGTVNSSRTLSQSKVREYLLDANDSLKQAAAQMGFPEVDFVVQPDTPHRTTKKLVVFDMDSTLIEQEVIDMIAAHGGIEPQVAAITEAAMRGDIDFTQSLKQRVSLLEGIPTTVFDELREKITFTPGARELCKLLKVNGYKLAVLSGGFIPLARYVQSELGLDYAYANNLEQRDGQLTGATFGRVINATAKAELLAEIAASEQINLSDTLAVGDGSNDLEMMHKAGFGIAFNAKPKVQIEAPGKINVPSLEYVKYVLGIDDS